jgi:flagellar basal body rod protein FlgG
MDLMNKNIIGYKRHTAEGNNIIIDFEQGTLQPTNRMLDFAILGNGFFKIRIGDGRTAYTRAGEFTIDARTNELMTIDGYYLTDIIKIFPGFSLLHTEKNNLIAIYPNGEKINCGRLQTYELDTIGLYEDGISPRAAEKTMPEFIGRTGGMVVGIRNNGKNDMAIYFYKGGNERPSESLVINNYLENSNVDFYRTLMRFFEINELLNN